MPNNSDDHFLILVWRLVTRHDDFRAGQVLQLVHLWRETGGLGARRGELPVLQSSTPWGSLPRSHGATLAWATRGPGTAPGAEFVYWSPQQRGSTHAHVTPGFPVTRDESHSWTGSPGRQPRAPKRTLLSDEALPSPRSPRPLWPLGLALAVPAPGLLFSPCRLSAEPPRAHLASSPPVSRPPVLLAASTGLPFLRVGALVPPVTGLSTHVGGRLTTSAGGGCPENSGTGSNNQTGDKDLGFHSWWSDLLPFAHFTPTCPELGVHVPGCWPHSWTEEPHARHATLLFCVEVTRAMQNLALIPLGVFI